LGFVIHLGHDGIPCLSHSAKGDSVGHDASTWEEEEIDQEDSEEEIMPNPARRGNEIVFVTETGVHRRSVLKCMCPNAPKTHLQLFWMRFFPATLKRPATAFTFGVLDQFHVEAVECKMSALNFYSKLRRMTSNSFPSSIPVTILTLTMIFIEPYNL
jgi:hypothetical protein